MHSISTGFQYPSGTWEACPDDADHVSMIQCVESLLVTLPYFFAEYCDGHTIHTCLYIQLDSRRDYIINLLPTGKSPNLNIAGPYKVIRRAGFSFSLSIVLLQTSCDFDGDISMRGVYPFFENNVHTWEGSNLPQSEVA